MAFIIALTDPMSLTSPLTYSLGSIKTEIEELDQKETYSKEEREEDFVPKEEQERTSEDGMEDVFDEEEEDEERDVDEDGDTLNEPQDLSLVDYSRYNSAALPETISDGAYLPGTMTHRNQTTGKLNCDICGLSCVSINVLLVHKRSHTGKKRITAQTPALRPNT